VVGGKKNPDSLRQSLAQVVSEINAALARIRAEDAERLTAAILRAKRVYVAGSGRSGLVGSCLAMRLVHLGLVAHVVGEATAPGLADGDLLIVSSGSGRTRTVLAQATAAKNRGALLAAVTAFEGSPLAKLADVVVIIPCAPFAEASDKRRGVAVETAQFGGSLYEQSLLLFYDSMVLELAHRLGRSPEDMQVRHSNLE
jgi:6-phospho-3-hexuloisomerase